MAALDLTEFFDPDEFDDCVSVEYSPVDDLIVETDLYLIEKSGVLDDGSVRSPFFEIIINRKEVNQVKIGDSFTPKDSLEQYQITQITNMDNDLVYGEAEQIK